MIMVCDYVCNLKKKIIFFVLRLKMFGVFMGNFYNVTPGDFRSMCILEFRG